MKLLIVDDDQKNIEAAMQAAKRFPEHEFKFLTSPSQALREMGDADYIITDLFFPPNKEEELACEYRLYRSKVADSPAFDEVVREYYQGDWDRATTKLLDTLEVMRDGTIRGPLERLIQTLETHGRDATDKRQILENLPPKQFPYGGVLMLRARALGKSCVLITDLHRHATNYTDSASATNGMILLLPLMEAGIITIKNAMEDGAGSMTYVGGHDLVEGTKENPDSWAKAIKKAIAQ